MDFDRTSPTDGTQDLRARTARTQERLTQAPEAMAPPVRPAHGGPTASPRLAKEAGREDLAKQRSRHATSAMARFLALPADTELDIEVDAETQKVTVLVRDRATGALLREIPDGEAQTLLEKLREFTGTLIDRSF